MDGSDRRLTPAALKSFQLTKYQVVNEKSRKDGLSPILAASANGHLDVVRCLVKNGANINDLNPDGKTPLILAAKNGYQPLLRLLVNYGAKLDIQDSRGRTALMYALAEGHLELARILMNSGASQALVDRDGKTALFVAAECGHLAIVEQLLMDKTGMDLVAKDRQGRTVLMMLARAGNAWPLYKYIGEIKLMETVNDRDSAGFTPLLHAAEAGKFSMAARLIKWGADATAVTEDGRTVIMLACQRPLVNCPISDSDPVDFGGSSDDTAVQQWDQKSFIAAMMKRGVAIDAADDKGRTALFYAAEYAELPMLQHLVSTHSKVLKVDSRDSAGNTILHAAARLGRESIVRYLTELPALARLINSPNSASEMPVRLAILSKNLAVVKLLIGCGASLEKADSCIKTPLLCVACENGAEDIVSFLLDRRFSPDSADSDGVTPLMAATRSDHASIALRLLKAYAKVNMLSKKGFSALTLAVQTVNVPICKILLDHKADPNFLPAGKSESKTLCSIAATLDSLPLLELLIDFKADPFQLDSQGHNAFYYSVVLNRLGPLRLLARRSDSKHLDALFCYQGKQYTLLHIAAERGSKEAVKILLSATPYSETLSSSGETPLHIACRRQDLDIVAMLTAYSSILDTPRKSDQLTPMMIAGQLGNLSIVMDLIAKGADVNKRSPDGFTALNLAAKGHEPQVDRMPLINSLLKNGAKFEKEPDERLIGKKVYNVIQALDRSMKTGSTQAKNAEAQAAAQSKSKTSTPLTTEERLKAKLKKKQQQTAETPKAVEVEKKKTEPLAVRAKKAREEIMRTLDTGESTIKRISSMIKKYVDVTTFPDLDQDESGDSVAKEMKKQDITRVYKHPFMLSQEQLHQNRIVSEFSKKMNSIREEAIKKFEQKLDLMCNSKAKHSKKLEKPTKVLTQVSDSSDSSDQISSLAALVDIKTKKSRRVQWEALYQVKYQRKSSKLGSNAFRSLHLKRLKVLAARKAKKLRRHQLPHFWENFRQREVVLRSLAPRMRWLMEALKQSESHLMSQFSYIKLEGVATGVHGASVSWQPVPELPVPMQNQSKTLKSSKTNNFKSQMKELATLTGLRCNVLVRCGQRPTDVKLFNSWNDKQLQLDLTCSLQPELFHVRQRIPGDRRPEIAVRLTVDTRRCLWDSRELRSLGDSLVTPTANQPADDSTMNHLMRQRRLLQCLMQRSTYQRLQAVGVGPQEFNNNTDVATLHPFLATKLVTVALHVCLARTFEAPYSVHGDDLILYHQPDHKELKLLQGLLGHGRIKLIEVQRFTK